MSYNPFPAQLTRFNDPSWDPVFLKAGNAVFPISSIDITPDAISWSGTTSTRPTYNNTPSSQLTGFFPPLVITASFTGSGTNLYAKVTNTPFLGTDYMVGSEGGWFLASNGVTHYPFKVCAGQYLGFCVTANKATTVSVSVTNTTAGVLLGSFSSVIV